MKSFWSFGGPYLGNTVVQWLVALAIGAAVLSTGFFLRRWANRRARTPQAAGHDFF